MCTIAGPVAADWAVELRLSLAETGIIMTAKAMKIKRKYRIAT